MSQNTLKGLLQIGHEYVFILFIGYFFPKLFGLFQIFAGFVIPVDLAPAEEVGAFTGLMLTVGFGGVVVGPPLIGFLRDASGGNLLGLLVMLGIAVAQLWLTLVMPETSPRHR